MKKLSFILITTLLSLCSCSSIEPGQGASAIGAAAAGTLAWQLTEGKSNGERLGWTAASAIGAYALGEHIRGKIIESEQKHFDSGYQAGLADAAKRQYEIIQTRQKENNPAQKQRYVIYEFPGVTKRDGVNFVPHTVKLRVLED